MIHKTWSNSHRLYLDRARPSQGQSATSFKLPRRSILRSLISTVVLGFENFGKNTSGDGEKGRSGKLTWNGCGTERRGQKNGRHRGRRPLRLSVVWLFTFLLTSHDSRHTATSRSASSPTYRSTGYSSRLSCLRGLSASPSRFPSLLPCRHTR